MDKENFRLNLKDFVRSGKFRLRNDEESTIYIDLKKACGDPILLNFMADELRRLMPQNITCVAAKGFGGYALASAISSRYDLLLAVIRDEEKEHGLKGLFPYYTPKRWDVAAIVDDVFTSGSSINEVRKILECKIAGAYVVVNRGDKTPEDLHWLFTLEELTV